MAATSPGCLPGPHQVLTHVPLRRWAGQVLLCVPISQQGTSSGQTHGNQRLVSPSKTEKYMRFPYEHREGHGFHSMPLQPHFDPAPLNDGGCSEPPN